MRILRSVRSWPANVLRTRVSVVTALVALVVALVPATSSQAQLEGTTFEVDDAGDLHDVFPGDGSCDTEPAPEVTTCTLRAAIEESNFSPGPNTITFGSSLLPIQPTTALPAILEQVEIVGNSGFTSTEIDGSNMLEEADGLVVLGGSGSIIGNLRIKGFGGAGVRVATGASVSGSTIFLNGDAGIEVEAGASDSVVFGNALSQNGGPGIRVLAGPVSIQGNSLVQNAGDGVEVVSGSGVNISGGGFLDNGGLGIDLDPDGVTPNDPGDTDVGPNGLQNFPVLSSATTTGTRPQPGNQQQVVVSGTIDTAGPVTVRIYQSETCDESENGEGMDFVGEATGVGPGAFTITLQVASVPGGNVITATATDSGGSTSEFSNCTPAVLVGADLGATKTASPGAGPDEFVTTGNAIEYTVTVSNAGPDPATNVALLDVLPHPSLASFGSAAPSQGTCGTPNANGELSCQLGTIAVGGAATIVIEVTALIDSATILENQAFTDADQTDPFCTLEPAEPGQSGTPPCDGAVAVTRVEPADGQAGGFLGPGGTLATGTTATESDPTVVSLTNDGTSGTSAALTEVDCSSSDDPLCDDPNIVGGTLADVSMGDGTATAAAVAAAPAPPAPFTATLLYDRTILPPVRLHAYNVYADTLELAKCSRKVSAPCVRSVKSLAGSKDLEVKVALTGSAKLRTSTS